MARDIFRRKKYVTVQSARGQEDSSLPAPAVSAVKPGTGQTVPSDSLWLKCPKCGEVLFHKNLEENARVCPKCEYHFRISARERLALLADQNTFQEWDADIFALDPLEFPGYERKLAEARAKSELSEAVLTGRAQIHGFPVVLAFNEGDFMMGSLGSVMGEKLTRAIERAIEQDLPVVIFSNSGGARMQEGILSLYQMAKTSAALGKLAGSRLLYISVLTDPTFGGVTASYASLGDILIAEPNALIGFTGPRVIKQTMRQELPPGAQTAEFNQRHGLIDLIVRRDQTRSVLVRLLQYHQGGTWYGATI